MAKCTTAVTLGPCRAIADGSCRAARISSPPTLPAGTRRSWSTRLPRFGRLTPRRRSANPSKRSRSACCQPPALHLDLARRRRGLFGSMAAHQDGFHAPLAPGVGPGAGPARGGARDLAAPVLGARDYRRGRPRGAYRIRPREPGETPARGRYRRLAVFVLAQVAAE